MREVYNDPCLVCGFHLYNPIVSLETVTIGLYDTALFPGRLIVKLHQHYDYWEDMTKEENALFMSDIKSATVTLREVTQCARVNFAILGNAVSHVHAHLIPRYPLREDHPQKAPWQAYDNKTPQTLSYEFKKQFISDYTEVISLHL